MALLPSSGRLNLSQIVTEYDRRIGLNVSGTSTGSVTVPTGTTMITTEIWAGGGSGGGGSALYGGGGGAGGAYGFSMFTSGFTAGSSTISYNAGAGGTAVAAGVAGNAGANSNVTPSWTGTKIDARGGGGGGAGAFPGGPAGTSYTCTNAEYNVNGGTASPGTSTGGGAGGPALSGLENYGITQGTAGSAGAGGNGGGKSAGGSAGSTGKVQILFFGAGSANTLASFTRYGNYVPNHNHNSGILVGPLSTSNRQKLTNYYSTARNFNSSLTIGSYSSFFTYYGYNNVVDMFGVGTPTFGSMTQTIMGTKFQASTQATISSLTEYYTGTVYVLNLYLNPNTTGIYWSKFSIAGGTPIPIFGGNASGTVGGPGNAYVNWSWASAVTYGLYGASGSKSIEFII